MDILYKCPPNITSFSQCVFPKNVSHVFCAYNQIKSFQYLPDSVHSIYCSNNHIKSFKYLPRSVNVIYCNNNQIKSFKYLPGSVRSIYCGNNQINSFQYLPGSVLEIYCPNNQINSFQYLPGSVTEIYCENNQIKSFQYLPESVCWISCENNTCNDELSKGLSKIHQENKDIIILNFKVGIEKLRYMRLNYMVHTLWKRYWYEQRDTQGYSRACRYIASKNCPNGLLIMN